jgi:hypothetical protein
MNNNNNDKIFEIFVDNSNNIGLSVDRFDFIVSFLIFSHLYYLINQNNFLFFKPRTNM